MPTIRTGATRASMSVTTTTTVHWVTSAVPIQPVETSVSQHPTGERQTEVVMSVTKGNKKGNQETEFVHEH